MSLSFWQRTAPAIMHREGCNGNQMRHSQSTAYTAGPDKKEVELTKRLYRGKRLETKRSAILKREIRARRNCLIISSKGALATGEFNSSKLGNKQEACKSVKRLGECTRARAEDPLETVIPLWEKLVSQQQKKKNKKNGIDRGSNCSKILFQIDEWEVMITKAPIHMQGSVLCM